jgi:hypothetical protein
MAGAVPGQFDRKQLDGQSHLGAPYRAAQPGPDSKESTLGCATFSTSSLPTIEQGQALGRGRLSCVPSSQISAPNLDRNRGR